MARIGRNQPCSCGSGKKYKVCHLLLEEESQRTPATSAAGLRKSFAAICGLIHGFVKKRFGVEALRTAGLTWPGDPGLARTDTRIAWALFHAPHQGSTLAARFREARGYQLSAADKELLDASLAASFSLYQVIDCSPSVAHIEDLFGGARHQLGESLPWGPSCDGGVVLARVQAAGGATLAQLGSEPLPAAVGLALAEQLRSALAAGSAAPSFERQTALVAAFDDALAQLPQKEEGLRIVHEKVALAPGQAESLRAEVEKLAAEDPDLRLELFDDAIELEAVADTSEEARAALDGALGRLGLARPAKDPDSIQ